MAMFEKAIEGCMSCPIGTATSGPCPFSRTRYPSGAVLCAQDEASPALIFVLRGYVALNALSSDGTESEVSIRGPGSVLALEALRGGRATREARALGPVTVCSLQRQGISRWLGPDKGPVRALLSLAMGELGRERFEHTIRKGSALRRVAALALACDGMMTPERRGMTKATAARLLGMRPETFSRSLRWLSDQGLIDARRGLRVLDPARLAPIAGQEAMSLLGADG